MYLIRPSRTSVLTSEEIERVDVELDRRDWELTLEEALEFSARHEIELNLDNEHGQNVGHVRPDGDYRLR